MRIWRTASFSSNGRIRPCRDLPVGPPVVPYRFEGGTGVGARRVQIPSEKVLGGVGLNGFWGHDFSGF